jgi:transcriptional regulator with XRE-family HTH domain
MRSGKKISGARLRDLRERRLMSPPELAAKAGLHPVTIHDIEGGRRDTVHFGTIRKLATAFEMSSEEFISEVSEAVVKS